VLRTFPTWCPNSQAIHLAIGVLTDRNKSAAENEQKTLEAKCQQVKEAYEEMTRRKAV